jgi:hypothetical protein
VPVSQVRFLTSSHWRAGPQQGSTDATTNIKNATTRNFLHKKQTTNKQEARTNNE